MNAQRNSSDKPLLVLRADRLLSKEQREHLAPFLEKLASQLGAVAVLEEPGMSVSLQPNPQVLLDAMVDAMVELTESNKQVTRSILMLASAVREQAAAIEALLMDEGLSDDGEGFTTLDGR